MPDPDALGELPLTERVTALALALGFDLVGVARAEPGAHAAFLREWLARGYGGEMAYLARNAERRADPRRVLPGARSVIALGLVYDPGARPEPLRQRVPRRALCGRRRLPRRADRPRARARGGARAARGRARAHARLRRHGPGARARVRRATRGSAGSARTRCLIHPRLGSYLFLGVVLTDLALEPDAPEPDHCGSCRACLDACPTDAFPEPYVLDATRCLSYTTIELRGAIPEPLRARAGRLGLRLRRLPGGLPVEPARPARGARRIRSGCARGSRRARRGARPRSRGCSRSRREPGARATRGTALRRTGYRGLLRNALVAAGNSRRRLARAARAPAPRGRRPLLAEHARWALERLRRRRQHPASDGGIRTALRGGARRGGRPRPGAARP